MVSESLKRFAARASASRSPANRILEPGTAAQFREEWVHLSGVPLVRLSQDEALAVWNARQRLLGILRIERYENSLTFYIGSRQCGSGAPSPIASRRQRGPGWFPSRSPLES